MSMQWTARRFVLSALLVSAIAGCTSMGGGSEPRRYSDEWWAREAEKPVGARQKDHKGKLWPPYPRPADDGGQQCCHEYHAAHYWPYPYICEDRSYVRNLSQAQINNGWITETTLYSYHFNEETHELTDSGRLHLRWILENVPPEHRMVWVQTAPNKDVAAVQLLNVRSAAVEIAGEENLPGISHRVTTPTGRPALEVDAIRRLEIQSIPEPRIVIEALPTGTGGGGS
ncbi:MAG: hypothetical protein AB7O26_04715 [Planctomycetaceae bacterium]